MVKCKFHNLKEPLHTAGRYQIAKVNLLKLKGKKNEDVDSVDQALSITARYGFYVIE